MIGKTLVLIVTALYTGIAIDQAFKLEWPMVAVWGGYALANVGMFFVVR